MRPLRDFRPATLLVTSLAALTTWVTLFAWTPFAENAAGFMWPLLVGVLIVAGVGLVLRTARVPALLVLLAQLVVVGLWLQLQLAADQAIAGLLPTPDSLRVMGQAYYDAGVAAQEYSAPVPASAPEFYPLLILCGTLTAVLVDFLAAGLRRAPLAGLPLLAAYTAPVSILAGDVSWVNFVAAALCFVFLLAAEQEHRLMHWGQHLTPPQGTVDVLNPAGGVWSATRKIGFTATALALVVPLVVPTFSATLFDGPGGTGTGDGDAVAISNPMVDLKRDLVRGADIDLVTLRTDDPDPSYLRISVLNAYDGNAWRPSQRDIPTEQRADGEVAAAPGLDQDVPSREYRTDVEVSEYFTSRWLPAPYPITSIDARGDWRWDRETLDVISAAEDQDAAGLSYRLRALKLDPSAQQLVDSLAAPIDISRANTSLPRDFPEEVDTLATQLTEGEGSRFEQAVALQKWFREDGGFRYSLQRSSGNGADDLLAFLRPEDGGRVGYCEQFAAAMAVMGRSVGIPSRVAVGFLRPDETGPGTFVYSTHDLHAWPEMYFDGVGWVRFEPTPQGRTGGVPGYTTEDIEQTEAPSASASSTAPTANQANRTTGADQAAGTSDGGSPLSGTTGVVLGVVLALLLVLLLLAPRAIRVLVGRRRWAAADSPASWVEAAWSEIRDTALDLGIAWDDHVTVRTAGAHLELAFGNVDAPDDALSRGVDRGPDAAPEATAALRRLVLLLERSRYSRSLPEGAASQEQVRRDLDACLEAMWAGAARDRRTWATWLPVSVLSSVRTRRQERARRLARVGEPGVDRAV